MKKKIKTYRSAASVASGKQAALVNSLQGFIQFWGIEGEIRPVPDSRDSGAITINFPHTGAQFTIMHSDHRITFDPQAVFFPSSED